jgi:predicted Zn-dependent protease
MVLAHEISHTIARHSAEKMTQQMTIPVLRFVLFSILGADFAGVPLQLGLELPYSRICENEADEIGLQLMARACFDPRAGPKALGRLSAGNTIPEYLSTHPHSDTRVSKLKSQLPKAIEEYESRCHATRSFFSQSLSGSSQLF